MNDKTDCQNMLCDIKCHLHHIISPAGVDVDDNDIVASMSGENRFLTLYVMKFKKEY